RKDAMHPGKPVYGCAEAHTQLEALDDVARATQEDVQAEHAAAAALVDDLEQARSLPDEREALDVLVAGDVHVEALLAGLLLGHTDRAELGVGEDRGRQHRVVGGRAAGAEHVRDRDSPLVLRDRRELRARAHVPGGPDPLNPRPQEAVYD